MTSELREPAPWGQILDEGEIHESSAGRASLGTLARLYRAVGRCKDAAQLERAIDDGRPLSTHGPRGAD